MHKWKWVVLATILALAGLIVGLSRLARHQKHGPQVIDNDAGASSQPLTDADAGTALVRLAQEPREAPNGSDVRLQQLPATAPNDVVFGAILITFEGVQGAPAKARSKAAAKDMAQRLLALAQTSFEDAVKQGDPGSSANAGSIRRGILEPALEYALFTLEKGAVYPEPFETPRGYWIMRRIR